VPVIALLALVSASAFSCCSQTRSRVIFLPSNGQGELSRSNKSTSGSVPSLLGGFFVESYSLSTAQTQRCGLARQILKSAFGQAQSLESESARISEGRGLTLAARWQPLHPLAQPRRLLVPPICRQRELKQPVPPAQITLGTRPSDQTTKDGCVLIQP
jgi:hypothetical protein